MAEFLLGLFLLLGLLTPLASAQKRRGARQACAVTADNGVRHQLADQADQFQNVMKTWTRLLEKGD